MTTMTERSVTTQVYQVFIKAITGGDLGRDHEDRVGGAVRLPGAASSTTCARAAPTAPCRAQAMKEYGAPDVIVDGEVIEADPPRKLVQTWRCALGSGDGGGGADSPHLGDRGGRGRRHEADGDPRARGRGEDGCSGRRRGPERGRRRLELDPERPEDAARDRQGTRRLRTNPLGGGPRPAPPARPLQLNSSGAGPRPKKLASAPTQRSAARPSP